MSFSLAKYQADIARIMGRAKHVVVEANVAALNRTMISVRAEVIKRVRKRYPGFKAAVIRAAMKTHRATRVQPVARIEVRGRRTPLVNFGAKQKGAGVSVRITRRKIVKGTFLATMKSGHTGVFWRTGERGRRGNPRLERIAQLFTLSVPQSVEQVLEQELASMGKFAELRYRVELTREIKFRVARLRGRA